MQMSEFFIISKGNPSRLLGQKLVPLLGVATDGSGSGSSSGSGSHSRVPSNIRTTHPRGNVFNHSHFLMANYQIADTSFLVYVTRAKSAATFSGIFP